MKIVCTIKEKDKIQKLPYTYMFLYGDVGQLSSP